MAEPLKWTVRAAVAGSRRPSPPMSRRRSAGSPARPTRHLLQRRHGPPCPSWCPRAAPAAHEPQEFVDTAADESARRSRTRRVAAIVVIVASLLAVVRSRRAHRAGDDHLDVKHDDVRSRMHVKMSLFRADGSAQDIVVTAEPTATVRDIASRIAAADPRRAYDPARRYTLQTASPIDPQWRLLPPDAVIGDEWLASGLSVALVDEADAAELLPSLHAGVTATVTVLTGAQTGHTVVARSRLAHDRP